MFATELKLWIGQLIGFVTGTFALFVARPVC